MTSAGGGAAVPTTVDNPADWGDITAAITRRTGTPPSVGLESLCRFVGDAVALLVDADKTGTFEELRRSFSPQVVAQLAAHPGDYAGCRPRAVRLTLIGAPHRDGDPVVRVRVRIELADAHDGGVESDQFWDVQMKATPEHTAPDVCPNCGAPLGAGALVCGFCRAEPGPSSATPLLVARLERTL
jgi:hypothetical protein